jgi:hypothetical protein
MGKTSALRGTNQQIELIGSHSNLARVFLKKLISSKNGVLNTSLASILLSPSLIFFIEVKKFRRSRGFDSSFLHYKTGK